MVAEGHEVGSHTASHAAGASTSQGVGAFTKSGIEQEMTGVEDVLTAIGSPMQLSVSSYVPLLGAASCGLPLGPAIVFTRSSAVLETPYSTLCAWPSHAAVSLSSDSCTAGCC